MCKIFHMPIIVIFLFYRPKDGIRNISVPTLILYEIHHIAFTREFLVTSRSPSGSLSHTNVVQHKGVDRNKLTPTHMSNPAISRPVSS